MCMRFKPQEFSLKQLQDVHSEIIKFKQNIRRHKPQDIQNVCKKLRQYCEMIVWGDKYNSDFVDYFCEARSLEMMMELFSQMGDKQILVTIIQNISMLLINLSREDSIHYFLSNGAVMKFQMMKFSGLDTELAQYYINFLKSVSIRLNSHTVKLFYNHKYPYFPLVWQAIKFYNHPESLIRNTSKNIVLSVAKIQDEKVQRYLGNFPFIIYYSHLSYFTFDISTRIDMAFNQNELSFNKLSSYYEDLYDLILYIQDLLSVLQFQAQSCLINAYMEGVIVFMSYGIFSGTRSFIGPKTAMFFFSVLMRASNCKRLLNLVVQILMGKYVKNHMLVKLEELESIHRLKSHNKKWSFQGFWDSFAPEIIQYSRSVFNEDSQTQNLSQTLTATLFFKGNESIAMNAMKGLAESDTMSEYTTKDTNREFQQNKPSNLLLSQISKIQRIHSKTIEPNTFVPPSISILDMGELFQEELKDSVLDLESMEDNHTKKMILGFLNSGQQHLVILTVDFISNIIKNKALSIDILSYCGLNLDKHMDYFSIETVSRIINSCLDILKTQGFPFAIETYKKVVSLLQILNQKDHIFNMFKERIDGILKEWTNHAFIFLTLQTDVISKLESYEFAHRQSRKSIIGLDFLQLLQQPKKLTECQKDMAVFSLLKTLRDKLHKQPAIVPKVVLKNDSTYILGNIVQPPKGVELCQLQDFHNSKSRKCYVLNHQDRLVIITSADNKVIFNMDIMAVSFQRNNLNSKKNNFKAWESDFKTTTLTMSYNSQTIASLEYNRLLAYKTNKAEESLNQIINALIEYQLKINNS